MKKYERDFFNIILKSKNFEQSREELIEKIGEDKILGLVENNLFAGNIFISIVSKPKKINIICKLKIMFYLLTGIQLTGYNPRDDKNIGKKQFKKSDKREKRVYKKFKRKEDEIKKEKIKEKEDELVKLCEKYWELTDLDTSGFSKKQIEEIDKQIEEIDKQRKKISLDIEDRFIYKGIIINNNLKDCGLKTYPDNPKDVITEEDHIVLRAYKNDEIEKDEFIKYFKERKDR